MARKDRLKAEAELAQALAASPWQAMQDRGTDLASALECAPWEQLALDPRNIEVKIKITPARWRERI